MSTLIPMAQVLYWETCFVGVVKGYQGHTLVKGCGDRCTSRSGTPMSIDRRVAVRDGDICCGTERALWGLVLDWGLHMTTI